MSGEPRRGVVPHVRIRVLQSAARASSSRSPPTTPITNVARLRVSGSLSSAAANRVGSSCGCSSFAVRSAVRTFSASTAIDSSANQPHLCLLVVVLRVGGDDQSGEAIRDMEFLQARQRKMRNVIGCSCMLPASISRSRMSPRRLARFRLLRLRLYCGPFSLRNRRQD